MKYMDGHVKSEKADVLTFLDGDGGPAHFVDNGNGRNMRALRTKSSLKLYPTNKKESRTSCRFSSSNIRRCFLK